MSPLLSSSLDADRRSARELEAAAPQLVPSTELNIAAVPLVLVNSVCRVAGVADHASDGLWQLEQLRVLAPSAEKKGLDKSGVVRLMLDHWPVVSEKGPSEAVAGAGAAETLPLPDELLLLVVVPEEPVLLAAPEDPPWPQAESNNAKATINTNGRLDKPVTSSESRITPPINL